MPTCPKCGHNVFLSLPTVLIGASSKAYMVYCRNCQAALGVVDTQGLNEKLDMILSTLDTLTSQMRMR